ncbi:DUF4253 domain-containing protein [Streptomyces sp. NPDC096311]|uniref:DUF4253 domain-containing protein n=1 Tax=Streptomyces sp. NPDC096311 TaxID=3366083 RepID=UPI00382F9B82
MTFSLPVGLPAGLPAGRAVPDGSPVMWRSDTPPSDPLAWWTRCQRQQGETGLLPILCYGDDDRPRSLDLAEIAAVDLEAELEQSWRAYRRDQLARLAAPSEPLELPEDIAPFVEPWEDDPGAPFDHWPGLAPATLASCGVDPDEAARSAFAHLMADDPYNATDARLGLVAAARSADIPAVVGWRAQAPLPLLCALLRSWEDRFGARVLTVVGATLYVSVASPPRDAQQAAHIALEHLLTTADNIVNDPPTPFPRYAASLVDAPLWRFWWD